METKSKPEKSLPYLAIFGLVLYLISYVSVIVWGYFVVNGIAMTISFLIIYYYLDLIIDKISFLKSASYKQQIYFLLLLQNEERDQDDIEEPQ